MFKKLLVNIIKFIFPLAILLLILILFPANKESQGYLNSYLDKISNLENHKTKSIIFLGGSNLVFGLDSKLIEDSFNIKVLNLGLQASLGIIFQMDQVEEYVNKGDIVILVPEYDQYIGFNAWGTGATLTKTIMHTNPNDIFRLRLRQIIQILPYLTNESVEKLKRWRKDDYPNKERSQFNKNGDFIGHLNLPNRPKGKFNYKLEDNAKENIFIAINEFKNRLTKIGVSCYLLPPPYPIELYNLNKSNIDKINSFTKKHSIPFSCIPEHFLYPDSSFFEYPHHLNSVNRKDRTVKLIQIIKPYLN